MRKPEIILVEDDTNISVLLSRQLRRVGLDVKTADTLASARELLRGGWDLLLLDRMLPDGDGAELCRELRAQSSRGYIMMLTGESSDTAKLEGFACGADDYVTKPAQFQELLARIRAGLRIVELQHALIESNRKLEELSLTDAMTSLRNRRAFDEQLTASFEHAKRYERPLSLVVVDIDHFKMINDGRGHTVGDGVLRGVAQAIAHGTRQTDFVARIGGEEFAILLPETALFDALQFGEKIRSAIAGTTIQGEHVTVSIGIANVPHCKVADRHQFFEAADLALYRAKQNGRNRVEMERRRTFRSDGGSTRASGASASA